MTRLCEQPAKLIKWLRRDIEIVAVHIANDADSKFELQQEMACELLSLPPGQTRAWYLSRVGDHARKYYFRKMQDIPLNHRGRPVLDRRTVCVGGLTELDRLSRHAA